MLVVYTDDSTYRISNKLRINNQRILRDKLQSINTYLNTNDLIINMDKRVLTECMIKQKSGRTAGSPPELEVKDAKGHLEVVKDSQFCRVLGGTIQNNLTWIGHLETAKKAILPEIRRNLGMMKSLGRKLPKGCRNTLARGMIVSKLTYLISICEGATRNHRRKPQILLNNTARWASYMPRKTKISNLMERLDWITIHEMTIANSSTLIWKLLYTENPLKVAEKLDIDRQSMKINITEPRIMFIDHNFTLRVSKDWNMLERD